MVATWPRIVTVAPLRQVLRVLSAAAPGCRGHAAEIAVLRRGENIDHRLDIVVLTTASDCVREIVADAAQNLQAAAVRAAGDRGCSPARDSVSTRYSGVCTTIG